MLRNSILTDGETVHLLIQEDPNTDEITYRKDGQWVPVTTQDYPEVLDEDYKEYVDDEALELWDAQGESPLADFEPLIEEE